MASLLNGIRHRGRNKAPKREPAFDPTEFAHLPSDTRVLDIDLDKFNETVGLYQRRHFVITAKVLAFAKCGDEIAIATVPLHEITKCYNVGKDSESSENEEAEQALDISRTETFSRKGERVSDVKVFEIRTSEEGMNGGKRFRFRANTSEEAHKIVDKLKGMIWTAIENHRRLTKYQKSKAAVAKLFWSNPFQLFVALLIFANFIFNIAQNQPVPDEGSASEAMFENIDLVFTIVFTIELVINAYGNWAQPFFTNGWSMFDLLVVSVSLLALFLSNLPGFSLLRLMRVFRVVRLFGRLKSLKKIVNAIIASIIPVLNSFVILFLITCIYALIGVSFFSERVPDIFGTFAQAIIVLFQLTAGNSWITELPAYDENGHLDAGVVTYLVSYIVIVNWTLLQVTVAVLLDNFVSATAASEHEDMMQAREDNPVRIVAHSLDPLLEVLVNTFDTEDDLKMRIHGLFDIMDEDESGSLSEQELLIGLRSLPVEPHLHILSDDLDQILQKSKVSRDGIAKDEFTHMMFGQCIEYSQRRMTDVIKLHPGNEETVAGMGGMKLALTMVRQVAAAQREGEERFAQMQASIDKQSRNIEAIMRKLGVETVGIDDEPWGTVSPGGPMKSPIARVHSLHVAQRVQSLPAPSAIVAGVRAVNNLQEPPAMSKTEEEHLGRGVFVAEMDLNHQHLQSGNGNGTHQPIAHGGVWAPDLESSAGECEPGSKEEEGVAASLVYASPRASPKKASATIKASAALSDKPEAGGDEPPFWDALWGNLNANSKQD